jgi:hypothetical protein
VSARSEEFARRRAGLQLQCALQREQFAKSAAEIGADLRFIDHGLNIVRNVRIVPMILGAISALGVASRAGGLVRLVGRAWLLFNTVKRIKRALR